MIASNNAEFIKKLQSNILKKKLFMNFIISVNEKYDMLFRIVSWSFILTTPVLTLAIQLGADAGAIGKIVLITSTLSASLMKLKSLLNFERIIESAKSQNIKYGRLYQKIEEERIKTQKQSEDEFIYWIMREFNNFELNDPDVSYRNRNKFVEKCKAQGITIDEDLEMLLMTEKDMFKNASRDVAVATSQTSTIVNIDSLAMAANGAMAANATALSDNATAATSNTVAQSTSGKSQSYTRHTLTPRQIELAEYNDSVKRYNNRADLQWTRERLAEVSI